MKKVCFVLVLALFLTGCGRETFETVSDIYDVPALAQPRQLELALPEEAAVQSMESSEGILYLCDGYTLTLQTMDAGDLDRTLRQCTGFTKDQLTVMETQHDGVKRYDCVWSAAGEGGDQVGRAAVLDDGSCHYVVTVMANFAAAGDLADTWENILDSISLSSTD